MHFSLIGHILMLLIVAAFFYLWLRARRKIAMQINEIKKKESIINEKSFERENLNIKLTRAYKNLSESEKNFRQILRKLPIPFLLYDHEQLSIRYVNERFSEAYGYELTDFVKDEHFLQALCPDADYRVYAMQRWCETFNDLILYSQSVRPIELQITDKTENIHRVEMDMVKIGNVFIATFNDTTERFVNEESLRFAKEKAEQADKMKSAFLANVSHEIRNPMNGIMGFVQLLTRTTDPEKIRFYTSIILQNSHRLISILNDVLEISKIEAGHITISKKPFALNQMMSGLQRFYENQISLQKKKIEVRFSPGKGEDFILNNDDTRLYQVLNNLLNNALKFTETGLIEFGYQCDAKSIHFFVKDTGIGIDEDKQKLIFERFYQIEEHSRKVYGGTGLGLSIAQGIIEKLGGKLAVHSKPEKGSEFFFSLPFEGSADALVLNDVHLNDFDLKGKKILVVDDEIDNFQMIKEALLPLRAKIIHACDGKLAVELCKDDPKIDLVIMDIKLKGMSGTEATNSIKQFRKELPIIAHTADGFAANRCKCSEAGCNDFILKPVDVNELIEKIAKYLK